MLPVSQAQTVKLRPEPWRWGHPRVLVEHPDEQAGLAISSALRFAGYAVVICPGPPGRGKCPLTGPEGCAPAHDADLVVCALGYEGEKGRAVLREMRTRYPSIPVLVEVPSEMDAELAELLNGCEQLAEPATPEQVVSAVQRLLGPPGTEDHPGGA